MDPKIRTMAFLITGSWGRDGKIAGRIPGIINLFYHLTGSLSISRSFTAGGGC
jgi:hypothetical protein